MAVVSSQKAGAALFIFPGEPGEEGQQPVS